MLWDLFYTFAIAGFLAGTMLSKTWTCFAVAECLAILGLGFIFVVGGSLVHDEISIPRFVLFLGTWMHLLVFALTALPVLSGHLVRRLLFARMFAVRTPETN
jgi:biotin transporter BioY